MINQILCIILLIFEVDEKKIMAKLGVSYNTLKRYSNMLKTGTLAALFIDNTYKNKSGLENYTDAILSELEKNPARTLREAAVAIEKLTGLKRSLPQVRNFLKKRI